MLREINNIYIPTAEEYAALGKIINDKEKMYDYFVAKDFEFNLWSLYQTDRFRDIPIYMYDIILFEHDKALILEMLKALIKMYPEISLERLPLGEQNKSLALNEMLQNEEKMEKARLNYQPLFGKGILEYLKYKLELSSRYRFEYRRYNYDARLGLDGQIDLIFSGKINSQNIKNSQNLQNLLYIDPIYITKISDEEYQQIYGDRKIAEDDIPYLKNRDAKLAIDSFVSRYKFETNIWGRNNHKPLDDKEYKNQCKKLIRQR